MAITYYVKNSTGLDTNSGLVSYDNAKKTVKGAVAAAIASGDTAFIINLFAETHTWAAGDLTSWSSTSNGKSFSLVGQNRDTTVITVNADTVSYMFNYASNTSNLTTSFKDITFTYNFPASAATHQTFNVQGTDGNTGSSMIFDNCVFNGVSNTTCRAIYCYSNYDGSISVNNCDFTTRNTCISIVGSLITLNITDSSFVTTAESIIVLSTTSTIQNLIITGNSFTTGSSYVAISGGAISTTSANISNNSFSTAAVGISFSALNNFTIDNNQFNYTANTGVGITLGYDVIDSSTKYGYIRVADGVISNNTLKRTFGTTTASGHGIMVGHRGSNVEIYNNEISGFWYQFVIKGYNCNIHHNITKGVTFGIFVNGSNNLIEHNSCYARTRGVGDGAAFGFNENQASLSGSGATAITVTQGNNIIQLPVGTNLTLATVDDDIINVTGRTDGICGTTFFRIIAKDDGLDQITISPTPTGATQNNLTWSIQSFGENNTFRNNIFDGGTGERVLSMVDPLIDCSFDYNVYTPGTVSTYLLRTTSATTKAEILSAWSSVFTGTFAQAHDNDQNSYVTTSSVFTNVDTTVDYISSSDDFTPTGVALGNATPSPCVDIGAIQITPTDCQYNSYCDCNYGNDLPIFRSGGYSISFWIKAYPNDGAIISEGGDGTHQFSINAVSNGKIKVIVDSSEITSAGIAMNEEWNNVVYVDSDGIAGLYINGEKDSSNFNYSFPSSVFTSTKTIVGALYNNGNYSGGWSGRIDELAAWNISLTPSDISQIYNNGCPTNLPKENNLIMWNRMGDSIKYIGTNMVLQDETENNNYLTVYGSAQLSDDVLNC